MNQLIMEEQKGKEEISEEEKFLFQLNKALYKFNTTKLDHELVAKLSQFSQRIMEKRRKGKNAQPVRAITKKEAPLVQSTKLPGSPSDIIEESDESMESSLRRSVQSRKIPKMKPAHLKNLSAVFTSFFLAKV